MIWPVQRPDELCIQAQPQERGRVPGVIVMHSAWTIVIGAAVVAAVLSSVALLILIHRSVTIGGDAETTLCAYRMVLEVIADHLKTNGGRWPNSWDELVNTPHDGCSGIRWPQDAEDVKNRVWVDFNVSTVQVVATDYDHFAAVRQIGPNYGRHEWLIAKFLGDAQSSLRQLPRPNVPRE
jgi:hypothetical protein